MTVTTPTAAAMFQSIGRWALTRVAAPSDDGLVVAGIDDIEGHQELVPDEDGAEQRRGHQPGPHDRQHHMPEHAEMAAAVDQRRIVDLPRHLVEEADHDPDDERQARRRHRAG